MPSLPPSIESKPRSLTPSSEAATERKSSHHEAKKEVNTLQKFLKLIGLSSDQKFSLKVKLNDRFQNYAESHSSQQVSRISKWKEKFYEVLWPDKYVLDIGEKNAGEKYNHCGSNTQHIINKGVTLEATPTIIRNLPDFILENLNEEEINFLSSEALEALSGAQVGKLSEAAQKAYVHRYENDPDFFGLRPDVISHLKFETVSKVMKTFSADQMQMISTEQLKKLPSKDRQAYFEMMSKESHLRTHVESIIESTSFSDNIRDEAAQAYIEHSSLEQALEFVRSGKNSQYLDLARTHIKQLVNEIDFSKSDIGEFRKYKNHGPNIEEDAHKTFLGAISTKQAATLKQGILDAILPHEWKAFSVDVREVLLPKLPPGKLQELLTEDVFTSHDSKIRRKIVKKILTEKQPQGHQPTMKDLLKEWPDYLFRAFKPKDIEKLPPSVIDYISHNVHESSRVTPFRYLSSLTKDSYITKVSENWKDQLPAKRSKEFLSYLIYNYSKFSELPISFQTKLALELFKQEKYSEYAFEKISKQVPRDVQQKLFEAAPKNLQEKLLPKLSSSSVPTDKVLKYISGDDLVQMSSKDFLLLSDGQISKIKEDPIRDGVYNIRFKAENVKVQISNKDPAFNTLESAQKIPARLLTSATMRQLKLYQVASLSREQKRELKKFNKEAYIIYTQKRNEIGIKLAALPVKIQTKNREAAMSAAFTFLKLDEL